MAPDVWLACFTENGAAMSHPCESLRAALLLVAACENPAEVADALVLCPDGGRVTGAELAEMVLRLG